MPDKVTSFGSDRGSQRLQEISTGEFAPEVYTVNAVTAAVAKQQMFLASTGRMTLAAAGNVRMTFQNPAGSGKTCYIVRVAGMTTATGYLALRLNPTTGLPSGARTSLNAVLGSAVAAVGVLTADVNLTTALGGGLDTGIVVGAPANQRLALDMPPIVVLPGVTAGFGVTFAGAADMTMSIYWFEE